MPYSLNCKNFKEMIRVYSIIGKKNNRSSVSDADREIPTLRSMDNAGNLVNLVSCIIRLPSGWDFSVCMIDSILLKLDMSHSTPSGLCRRTIQVQF